MLHATPLAPEADDTDHAHAAARRQSWACKWPQPARRYGNYEQVENTHTYLTAGRVAEHSRLAESGWREKVEGAGAGLYNTSPLGQAFKRD